MIGEHERKIQRIASSNRTPGTTSPEKERSQSPAKAKKEKKSKKDKKKKKEKKAKRAKSQEIIERKISVESIRSRSEDRHSPVQQVAIPMSERFKSTSGGGIYSSSIQQAYKIEINEEEIESEEEEVYNQSPMLSQKLSFEDEQFENTGSPKVKKEKKKKKKNKTKKDKKSKSSSPKSKRLARPNKPPAVISRRVVVVDPNTDEELNLEQALELGLIDEETALELCKQQGDYGSM